MRECTEGKHPDAWVARGDAARTGGDLATAEHNYSGAIRLYPHYWIAWTRRGLARFDRGDWKGAAEDFSKRLSLEPAGRARDFAALRLWLCRARLGGRDAASAELRAYRPSGETSEYPDIAAFLLSGRKEFESAAGGPGAAAWFFVGEKRLLDGDREGAIEALRECARLSPRGDAEGESARAELARLGVR
jgi:tetratricopeptide (TPR) repeat protein